MSSLASDLERKHVSGHNIRISYTFGGRPGVALDLPQYRNQTMQEHSITVAIQRNHTENVFQWCFWNFVVAQCAHQVQNTGTG